MLKTYRIIPLVFILFLFGFTLITASPVIASNVLHDTCETPCIADLKDFISGKIKGNISQYKDLMKTAIPSNKFVSTPTMNENLDKAEELAKQAAEAAAQAAQQKAAELAKQASGNYTEVLIEMLGAYTGKSGEIQTALGTVQEIVTASKTLYDVGSQAKACVDGNGAKYCIQEKLPEPHIPTMKDMESALDVANLRCSKEVPSKIATVLGKVVGLDGKYAEKFDADRAKVCQAIEKIYNLKYKLQQLEEIREDGYSLLYKYDKKRIKKKGRKRTVQHGIDLRYYPDIQESYNTGTISPEFSLDNENSFFKWSSNNKVYLADILNSSNTQDEGDAACSDDKPYWFKLAKRLKFRLKMANVTASDVDLTACLRVSWRGNHNRELATVTIPAPFGYLDELTQMKDAAAQNAMNSLQNQIADMLGINSQLSSVADKAADASIKAAQAAQLAEQKAAEQAAKQAAKQAAEAAAQAAQQKAEELAKQAAEAAAQAAQQKAEELAKQAAEAAAQAAQQKAEELAKQAAEAAAQAAQQKAEELAKQAAEAAAQAAQQKAEELAKQAAEAAAQAAQQKAEELAKQAAEAAAQAAQQKAEELAKQAAEAAAQAAQQKAEELAKQAAEAAAQAAQQKAEELAKQAAEAAAQAAQQKAEELAKQAAAQAQKDMAASPGQATTGSPNVAPGMAPPPGPPGMAPPPGPPGMAPPPGPPGMAPPPGPPGMAPPPGPPGMAPPTGDPAMAPPMGDPCMAVPAGPDRDACYATAPAPGMAPPPGPPGMAPPTGDPAVAPPAGQ